MKIPVGNALVCYIPAEATHCRSEIEQRLMNEFATINCPHCGEDFEIPFDPGEGNAEFVVDCEVCCRPMTVFVRVKAGTIENVEVSSA